jgi:antirestriction protein ArdC
LSITAGARGYDSNLWATFRQWKSLRGFVQRGERATKIVYWNIITETATDPFTGEQEEQKRIFARQYSVFNLCQTGGAALDRFREPAAPAKPFTDYEPAERLIESSLARVVHGGNKACYDIVADCIHLPEKHRFDSEADYYSTAMHELSHWTGHESRLNREFGLRFADSNYAVEELISEQSAANLCATLGIENTAVEQQAASYLSDWLRILKADRTAIFTASRMAAAASDYLLSFCSVEEAEELEEVPF